MAMALLRTLLRNGTRELWLDHKSLLSLRSSKQCYASSFGGESGSLSCRKDRTKFIGSELKASRVDKGRGTKRASDLARK